MYVIGGHGSSILQFIKSSSSQLNSKQNFFLASHPAILFDPNYLKQDNLVSHKYTLLKIVFP